MPLISTHDFDPDKLPAEQVSQIYCGLDTMVTMEVHEELSRLFPSPPPIYSFERALQAPYLEIMQRGFAVDELGRQAAARSLRARIWALQEQLNEYAIAVWGKPVNPRSPAQLKDFFYSARGLGLPEVWLSQKGERKISTNREALEKLEVYLYARPIIAIILTIRDLGKQCSVFETEIDSDGRFRASYNIAGTETGRPSSSENAFGTGGNAQNIAPGLRYVFVADPGKKLCVIDLEQVEARDTGFFMGCLFDDWKFLNNCESGDLHTNNCKLVWPELRWTGDPKRDRAIADQGFYREFTYRDMSKRGGHLCLTKDHEVLTPYGWEPISNKPIQIMSYSEKEGSQFSVVENWVDEAYEGENLHWFEGNSISALMTPNHRVPYRADSRHGKIKFKPAANGPGLLMPLGNGWVGGTVSVPARLIAAFMSDGYQKSTNRMEFNLRKERKISRLKELCEQYRYRWYKAGEKHIVEGQFPKKCGMFMFEWTKECLQEFLDEYKYWDGNIQEKEIRLFSIDKDHLSWIQTFGRITGIGGQITTNVVKSDFSGTAKQYETEYHSLGQNKRQFASGKSIKHKQIRISPDGVLEGELRVYCPTVKSGMFYVRRNGKIFVTGNSGYYGTAWTMSRALKIPLKVAETFQARYNRGAECAFPGFARWWQWTAEQLQTTHTLTTPFGRKRHFFGRPEDDTTLREAIAFLPQSTTADRMNLGLWRVWKHMPQVELLAQTYDSITFQYDENADEAAIVAEALQRILVELKAPNGRTYVVPGEAKIGWNWMAKHNESRPTGPKNKANPDGLIKWKSGEKDTRRRQSGLRRIML